MLKVLRLRLRLSSYWQSAVAVCILQAEINDIVWVAYWVLSAFLIEQPAPGD